MGSHAGPARARVPLAIGDDQKLCQEQCRAKPRCGIHLRRRYTPTSVLGCTNVGDGGRPTRACRFAVRYRDFRERRVSRPRDAIGKRETLSIERARARAFLFHTNHSRGTLSPTSDLTPDLARDRSRVDFAARPILRTDASRVSLPRKSRGVRDFPRTLDLC